MCRKITKQRAGLNKHETYLRICIEQVSGIKYTRDLSAHAQVPVSGINQTKDLFAHAQVYNDK
jgi:hypothetical protein